MTNIFAACKTLDELKKAYKAAALKNHPDLGGDTATMQAINAAYAERFDILKRNLNTAAAADETGKTHATAETAGDFIAIIDALLIIDGRPYQYHHWQICDGYVALTLEEVPTNGLS